MSTQWQGFLVCLGLAAICAVVFAIAAAIAPLIDDEGEATPEPFDQLAADDAVATAHRDFIIAAWLNRVQR